MAAKKNLPTMVEGVTETESSNKSNAGNKTATTNQMTNKQQATTTQQSSNSTPSSTPSATPSTTPSASTTTQSKPSSTTPATELTSTEKDYYDNLYVQGGWTQDQQEAISHGGTGEVGKTNSQGDWYSYETAERPYYADDADATFMDGSDYYLTTQNKNEWHALNEQKKAAQQVGNTALVAQLQAQMDALHAANEEIRAKYGYSGGKDGSLFELIDTGNGNSMGYADEYTNPNSGYTGGVSSSGAVSNQPSYEQMQHQNELKALLEEWQKAALEQSNGQIDYAVQKAITDLERALTDAQPQFKEQAETVDRDARQAMDNSTLYAELRGDKGGIGQEQYNSIQNTQAQNHLAVQQAQTKLATDTQRQIADLRAQGEFEKADAALEITQTYLAQLMSLEQWAAEYNLSVQEFQASLQQWEAEYQLALKQLEIGQSQWQQEFSFQQQQYAQQFAFQQQQYQDSLALNQKNQMANIAWSLLQAGVELDADQLKALDISADQANSLLLQSQLKSSSDSNKVGSSAGYKDVSANAKKQGSADLTNKYLGNMVESGVITLEEADWIFRVVCGYSYDQLYENKYIVSTGNTGTTNKGNLYTEVQGI